MTINGNGVPGPNGHQATSSWPIAVRAVPLPGPSDGPSHHGLNTNDGYPKDSDLNANTIAKHIYRKPTNIVLGSFQ